MQEIIMRRAATQDCERLYHWRNSELVRQYSFTNEMLDFNKHITWFENILKDDKHYLLIGEIKGIPMGVFRIDLLNKTNEISIYLNPEFIGKGLGEGLLASGIEWIKNNLPAIKTLEARVMHANIPSKKIFEKQGFINKFIYYEKKLTEE